MSNSSKPVPFICFCIVFILVGFIAGRTVTGQQADSDSDGHRISAPMHGNVASSVYSQPHDRQIDKLARVPLQSAKRLSGMDTIQISPCLSEFISLKPDAQASLIGSGEEWSNIELFSILKLLSDLECSSKNEDKMALDGLFSLASKSPSQASGELRILISQGAKGKMLVSRFFRSNQKYPAVNEVVLENPDLLALATASFTWIDQYGGTFGSDPEKLQKFVNGLTSELHRTIALDAGLTRNLKHYITSPDYLLGSVQRLSDRLKILKRWQTANPKATEQERTALMVYFDGDQEQSEAGKVLQNYKPK